MSADLRALGKRADDVLKALTKDGWMHADGDVVADAYALLRDIARLRILADAPLTVAEALRDERVRAGTHVVEYRDPWCFPEYTAPRGGIRIRLAFEAFDGEPGGSFVMMKQRYLLTKWSTWGETVGFTIEDLDAACEIVPAIPAPTEAP